ncbi:hypothetical protein HYPSUDRAFT_43133 [Hypholoma sublateritium FD-334 SS-4]|uniref:BTB domain-containing protein n=1 Tax=Hypholoma sublateritium (strain FD-334 SS-4) TaxID=945553 RepID=A0A0D2PKC6_HYPSF|nr:hypothetical protein HYPSUDRAFT_43133 [Hypholoma sublateritium FD-334 SS-4]
MTESIVLDNSTLLRGLVPPTPHVVVAGVDAQMHSPTSSTGSASVLEWNSNSDSELFQLSSPPSAAPALSSPAFSASASSVGAAPSLVGSLSEPAGLLDDRYLNLMHWPQLGYDERPAAPPAPLVSASATASSTAPTPASTAPTPADDAPAPHHHPAELNALIERMELVLAGWPVPWSEPANTNADANTSVSETAASETDSAPELLDTSITSSAADSSITTVIPPGDTTSFFDPPSPPAPHSAEASLISIAEYFKRKASERGAPLAHVPVPSQCHRRSEDGSVVISEREEDEDEDGEAEEERGTPAPASPVRSALSYFSPPSPSSTVASYSWMSRPAYNPPGRAISQEDIEAMDARSVVSPSCSTVERASPSPSVSVSSAAASGGVASSARDPFFDVYSPSMVATVVALGPRSAPVSDVLRVRDAHATRIPPTGAPERGEVYADEPAWPAPPPELEFRDALRAATPYAPTSLPPSSPPTPPRPTLVLPPSREPPLRNAFRGFGGYNPPSPSAAPVHSWLDQLHCLQRSADTYHLVHPPYVYHPKVGIQASSSTGSSPSAVPAPATAPTSAPAIVSTGNGDGRAPTAAAAPRRPRPPLPALPVFASTPRAKPQPSPLTPTPQPAPQRELPLPMGIGAGAGVGEHQPPTPYAPYAHALPSTWTGPASHVVTALPPSSGAPSPVLGRPRDSANASTAHMWWGLGKPPTGSPYASYTQPALRAARWGAAPGLSQESDTASASDGDAPVPPPACRFPGGPHRPPASDTLSTPPPWACERESERRLRFASPVHATGGWAGMGARAHMHALTPPLPPAPPPLPSWFYPAPPPPAGESWYRPSSMGMGMGLSAAPEQWYRHSSPAPVIPPAAAHAGWYTTVAKYAFSDATVVFRVETYIFRVHRHFFEHHSDYFVRLLSTYVFSEASHVFLPDVKKGDFERLLSIFYPENLTTPDITSLAGWTAVLALAQRWGMAQPLALSLAHIGTLASPMQKIAIAHTHGLRAPAPAWLLPAYKAVCASGGPPARHEAEALDVGVVLGIWEVQHALRQGGPGAYVDREGALERLVRAKFGPFDGAAPRGGAGMFVY